MVGYPSDSLASCCVSRRNSELVM